MPSDTAADKAERFLKTAVSSLMAFPLPLYALWLLFDLFTIRTQLGARARRQVRRGATVIAIGWSAPIAFGIIRALRPY